MRVTMTVKSLQRKVQYIINVLVGKELLGVDPKVFILWVLFSRFLRNEMRRRRMKNMS